MYVAIGHFKLKKIQKLFKFLRISNQIRKQALAAKGNVGVELSGGSFVNFYVVSKWNSMDEMREFTYAGAHMEAIKLSKEMASQIRLLYFETDNPPTIDEAKKMLDTEEKVRVID